MSPTPVDTGALAALIRRQVSPRLRTASAPSARGPDRSRGGRDAARAAGQAPADIGTVVARRVRALDPADPDRPRRAMRIFLESVLLAEFGPRLVNDAAFHRLVDDVQQQMAGDPALAAEMAAATGRLLQSA